MVTLRRWIRTPHHLNLNTFAFFPSLDAILKQSTPTMSVVFILTPGFDPSTDLRELADSSGFGGSKFRCLSCTQDQEVVSSLRSKVVPLLNQALRHEGVPESGCINTCIKYIVF
jgi:hypothetical protein